MTVEVRGAMLAASCLRPRTGLVTTVGSALMLLLMRLLSAMSFSITCTLAQVLVGCCRKFCFVLGLREGGGKGGGGRRGWRSGDGLAGEST